MHIITTKIEHHAVLETCEYLEQCGFSVTYVAPDEHGIVNAADVEAAIRPDTILISVMFANNEIGTIQPIRQIGQMAKEHGILFHTDAVQAVGHLPVDVKECGIDLLCASAHKFQGPKGTGFCYIKSGVKIGSLLHGGAQERHRRAGTLNVPGIVGMGEALKEALEQLDETMEYERNLRDYLVEQLTGQIPDTRLNGAQEMRLPNNANLYFKGVRGEAALIQLDRHGICCSTGSACTTGAADASHVLTAIGLSEEEAQCYLRFSLSAANTKEEIEKTIEVVKEVAARIRSLSFS
jgi:cysteine desulfurase